MEIVNKNGYEFIKVSFHKAEIYFSTAKGNLNFNIDSEEGKNNIINLKKWFNLKDVGYLRQIHSNLVYNFNGEIHQGDGLITNQKGIAIGILTADCVPVLLYDTEKKVAAAVHSGWKSTKLRICQNVIEKMMQEYGTKPENIIAVIGPHNKKCCYEFEFDLVKESFNDDIYENINIYNDGKLNLQCCIEAQLKSKGILKQNILSTDICTFCNCEFEFYSYRRNNKALERMFSFIVLRD